MKGKINKKTKDIHKYVYILIKTIQQHLFESMNNENGNLFPLGNATKLGQCCDTFSKIMSTSQERLY